VSSSQNRAAWMRQGRHGMRQGASLGSTTRAATRELWATPTQDLRGRRSLRCLPSAATKNVCWASDAVSPTVDENLAATTTR
jgi:hypothetical protein